MTQKCVKYNTKKLAEDAWKAVRQADPGQAASISGVKPPHAHFYLILRDPSADTLAVLGSVAIIDRANVPKDELNPIKVDIELDFNTVSFTAAWDRICQDSAVASSTVAPLCTQIGRLAAATDSDEKKAIYPFVRMGWNKLVRGLTIPPTDTEIDEINGVLKGVQLQVDGLLPEELIANENPAE